MSQEISAENDPEVVFQRGKELIEQNIAVLSLPAGFDIAVELSKPPQQRTVIEIRKGTRYYRSTSEPWVLNHEENPPIVLKSTGEYYLAHTTSPFIKVNRRKRGVSIDGHIFAVFQSTSSNRKLGFFIKKH